MIDKYVLATNDDGDLAIRTVSATESSSVTDTTSVITATDDGKLAVRVVGGGSDQHNLGWYATQAALEEAHPTAEAGDWAIVGSTDTVWLWDTDNEEWVDSDQKGQVTSVNNQTGAVTLTASDVGAATSAQGAKADTAVQPGDLATVATTGAYSDLTGTPTIPAAQVNSDWNASSGVAEILNKPTLATVATSGAYSDLTGTPTIPAAIQVSTMPTAAVGELDKIYQFIGTTDANYTNGYFYKCVSDGQDPATYSWTQTDVQPAPSGLPDQTGNAGKFLTTDGTDASWATMNALQNTATGDRALTILGTPTNLQGAINIGASTTATGYAAVTIGAYSSASGESAVCLRGEAASGRYSIAIGNGAKATATGAIMISSQNMISTNSDANTFKVANANGNFELMSADGTIPKERLTNVVTTPSTAPVLAVADWSSNAQTITVTGVTATNTVFVAPAPASAADYAAAGILCTAQAADSLTFSCTTVPTNAITVNVVILG